MRTPVLLLLLLAVRGPARADDTAPVELPRRFAQLLVQLDDDAFEVRETATKAVADLPAEALPLVEAALRKDELSVEARLRLETAVASLRKKDVRAGSARRRQVRAAWNHRTLPEAYDRTGHRDPKWDEGARRGLEAAAAFWSDDPGVSEEDVLDACRLATAAGCNDPLVLYVQARMADLMTADSVIADDDAHARAAEGLAASGYSPYWKTTALVRAADFRLRGEEKPSDATREAAGRMLAAALALLPEVAKDADVPRANVVDLAFRLAETGMRLEGDRLRAYERVAAVVEKAWPGSPIGPTLRGDVYIKSAWDARGSGVASTVTKEGWRLFSERLTAARTALEQAWSMDPSDPGPPTAMLTVELGQSRGREGMEEWFARAMDADPDNSEACEKKRYWLEPKWHGNPEAMLAFGRECLATGNWKGRLPLLLPAVHQSLVHYVGHETGHDPQIYFAKPEVWEDLAAAYEPFLQRYPGAVRERTEYAKLACYAGKWEVADAQFRALGDRGRVQAFGGRGLYMDMRRSATRSVARKSGMKDPPPATPPIGKVRITIQGDVLNVRSGPGTMHPVFGTLKSGDVVDIYQEMQGTQKWYRVYVDGTEGWISGKYAEVAEGDPRGADQKPAESVQDNPAENAAKGPGAKETPPPDPDPPPR